MAEPDAPAPPARTCWSCSATRCTRTRPRRRCAGSCGAGAAPGTAARPTRWSTFDEYTKLYLESWRDPEVRWLLSTVPSVMIFDDHEIIDDWNTSASWRADMSAAALVGAADRQRPRLLLGLPAPGQPEPGRDRRRPGLREGHARPRTPPGCCTSSAHTGRRAAPASAAGVPVELRPRPGPHPAGRAGQPVQPGADAGAAGDAAGRRVAAGSSTRPTATTTTWWSVRRCRG